MSQGDHKSASAECPYWEGKDKHSVYCEGVEEGSRLRLSFAAPGDKLSYCRLYCDSSRWKTCRIAVMLEQKWQDYFEDNEQ